MQLEALERRELLAADLLSATLAEGSAAADVSAAWMAGAEGEGGGALSQVRLRVVENIPAADIGPTNRTDLTTVSPGDTIRVEMLLKDLRTDDGDGDDTKDNFGVFANYVDLEYAAEAFSIPSIPPAVYENHPLKPVLSVPISFKNPNFPSGTEISQYPYPNAPIADVGSIPGVVNDFGSFKDGTLPIGTSEFFQADIQFTVESLAADDDEAVVYAGVPNQRIDVLANDALIEGRQWFVPASHRTHGAFETGRETLLFGYTGYDSEDPLDTDPEGVVVPPSLVSRLADYVDVVNPGTLQIDSFTQPGIGTITLNLDGTLGFAPNASAVPGATSSFTYSVSDGLGNTKTATVALTVPLVNMFTVNSTGDGVDVNPGDGVAQDASGNTTLRAAIQEANALANLVDGPDVILFDIPGVGPHTIQPTTALPTITQSVVIDATTEPDFAGTPVVELDGSGAGANVNGLRVTSGGSTIRGLVINRFDAAGIDLRGNAGNTVEGSFLGTDVVGTADLGNRVAGVTVFVSDDNLIGGTGVTQSNVISGNGTYGILVFSGSNNNRIEGNLIGTDVTGLVEIENGVIGIDVRDANNTIGGTAPGAGNVIGGSRLYGVRLLSAAATHNLVAGNLIGSDVNGVNPIPNFAGVYVENAMQNTIGGASEGAGNLLSGNTSYGVRIAGSTATANTVSGNLIGTSLDGETPLRNAVGIEIRSSGNTVGGAQAGDGNVISGNTVYGMRIWSTASQNTIQGNLIGTDRTGTALLRNGVIGVDLRGPDNLLGGSGSQEGNVITGANLNNVRLLGSTSQNNVIAGNLIGTDVTGTTMLGASSSGIFATGASNNTIGGTDPGAGNVVTTNNGTGILLNDINTTQFAIQGNFVGTDRTGNVPLPNAVGVDLRGPNNTVGGTDEGAGNTVAFNRFGVRVLRDWGTGNAIRQNSIYGNTVIGVDLLGNGTSANDLDDVDVGPNNLQNFPEIASAIVNGDFLDIGYSVPSLVAHSAYPLSVEFFKADASGRQGMTYLGADVYSATGIKSVSVLIGSVVAGDKIVATATDANGNTSEFSSIPRTVQ